MSYKKRSNEELCALAKGGDEAALEQLIRQNRAFIESLKQEITRGEEVPFVTEDEFVCEGELGIYEAVQGFDPEKGYSFLTFAGRIIRNKMRDLLKPFKKSKTQKDIDKVREEIKAEEQRVRSGIRKPVEEYVIRKLFLEQVRACFLKLPRRQQQILAYKFGIDPTLHPLDTQGRNLSDEVVAKYFGSKESLIRKSRQEAEAEIKRDLFGII